MSNYEKFIWCFDGLRLQIAVIEISTISSKYLRRAVVLSRGEDGLKRMLEKKEEEAGENGEPKKKKKKKNTDGGEE